MADSVETSRRRLFWKRYCIDGREAKLGEGRYGSVFRAKDNETGDDVAIKKIQIESDDIGIPQTTMRERTILKLLKGDPNIVKLRDEFYHFDVHSGEREFNFVFDYMSCDLKKYISRYDGHLPAPTIKSLMRQLCEGLQSMHSAGAAHRDLKPHNVLIDKDDAEEPDLRIADMGLGRIYATPTPRLSHEVGSLYYRAPEILLGTDYYINTVDTWSIGCIFAEMLTKKVLFCGSSEYSQLIQIFRVLGTPTEETWPNVSKHKDWHEYPVFSDNILSGKLPEDVDKDALDLCQKLLTLNPAERLQIVDVLKHPYFAEDAAKEDNENRSSEEESGTQFGESENITPISTVGE